MKRAFREAYDRELAILKERSTEFAKEYPGIADRLGGLMEENLDPAVAGLLEGSAFLAARVQLKMDEEFRVFTAELLDQIFPDALAPTPSAMLVSAKPPYKNAELVKGLRFEAGEYIDARFTDADKRVSCRFSLAAPLELWPLQMSGVKYHGSAGPVAALGQEIISGTKAGLEIELARVGKTGKADGSAPISEVEIDSLPIYFTGPIAEAASLYEQVLCDLKRVSLRYLDKNGDPVFVPMPLSAVDQIGFSEEEQLLPHQKRLFAGFAKLREAFVFQRKFLGIRLTGLKDVIPNIPASRIQVVLEFSQSNQKLATRLESEHLQLFVVPAVNLFEEISSQVRIDRKRHEYLITPNSSPTTHYEMQSIIEVNAFYSGHQDKVPVLPLYALPANDQDPRQTLYYTTRRKTRRLTLQEQRFGGTRYRYKGTETFIAIYEPPDAEPAQRLQVKGLCSNRHLPEYLPIAQSSDDFFLVEEQTVKLSCVAGPTMPRESLADLENDAPHRTQAGDVYWRLMSYLSLNHYGINDNNGEDAALSMREMLSLFADLSDKNTAARIQGLRKVETRPVTRTIAHPEGFHPARGLEVSLTFDENDFEGSGIVLFGAILDRFIAEYAAVNSLTQCVVNSVQRGHIKTFAPRSGHGQIL